MKLKFGEITRGNDKVFVHVEVEDEAPACTYRGIARTPDGEELPCTVMPVPYVGGQALILPVLGVAQDIRVDAVSCEDVVLASATRSVGALEAKMRSRLNTVTKNEVALAIRNCDTKLRPSGIEVIIDELIDGEDGTDVVHGRVVVASLERDEAASEVVLRFLGPDGHSAALRSWISMGDVLDESEDYPGTWVRTLSYSVRIPRLLRSLTVWASCPDTQMADGFSSMGAKPLRNIREGWHSVTTSAQDDGDYEDWYFRSHRASASDIDIQAHHTFEIEPTFSIVVPLYKTPLTYLDEMVGSVLAQSYPNFELILVNASTEDMALSAAVAAYAENEPRIKVVEMPENLGIVGNTQAGVAQATGDFICYLDHDDVIEPDLLYCYAKGVNDYPETDLIYCDEDKILDGHYICPFFKPDWNPDLLTSENYVCHLLTVRREIVEALPDTGDSYEGAQDHNLTLFAGERARNVYHARRILYHWRIHAGSTAAVAEAKDYTTDSGVRAVQAHLDRMGVAATAHASGVAPNTYRVSYELPEPRPLVSIVIPNKDQAAVLERLLGSICERTTYDNYEVVVVENGSVDSETFELYERAQAADERVRVVSYETDGSFNFSKLMNFGFAQATGDVLLSLNNDMEVITPDWLERLLGHALRSEVAFVGCKLLFPDGLVQHAGVQFHRDGPKHVGYKRPADSHTYFNNLQLTRDYSAITGACMMTRRSVFEELGGFDEEFPIDYNDVDLCLRARERGMLVVYEPTCMLYHYESISRGEHQTEESKVRWTVDRGRIMQHYPEFFAVGDPMLNPNLSDNPWCQLNKW